jgi:ferredoxin like protein
VRIEDRLAVNKYDLDREAHITVEAEACGRCRLQPCLFSCPAVCYTLVDGKVNFSYEGCLECGSCRVVCPGGAVSWTLPRPGLGISYEFG